MEISDGVFRDVDGNKYSQSWHNKYRIERVTELPGTPRVPVPTGEHYDQSVFGSATIIVGERGGGMSRLLDWLQLNPDWKVTDVAGARLLLQAWRRHEVPTSLRGKLSLIVDRTMPETGDKDHLAFLASVVEEEAWVRSGSRLICLTREVRSLRTDAVFSSILARGHLFRLPHFDANELEDWVKLLSEKTGREPLEQEIARLGQSAKTWVGGQPFLTHLFFCRAESILLAHRSTSLDTAFDEAGAFLANQKPHMAATWQNTLLDLIKLPSVLRLIEGYARGHRKREGEDNFPRDDVDLFLAGWVGRMADDTWGIRSTCHAQWAREVLRGGVR